MAHGWNPYLHNYSSLPSDHGTPRSEVTHPHPAEDFVGHGGFSSANISHGASAANRNYCFNSSIGNNSNWSSEIGHSQSNYREMAWQPDGEQKAYLPRWDSSVSNVLETGGHCSIAPQLGLKQNFTVPKDSPYFENYMNSQGPSEGVSEPQSSYEFMTSTSEHNPQTGATSRYHSSWQQTPTENASMSAHCTYSDTWPNLTAENANKSVQGGSKSLEHDGISFGKSYTYTDSETLRMGNFDPKPKQTFVNISQNANLSEKYSEVNSQTMMDAKDTSETSKGNNLASTHEAFTDQQATNTQIFYPRKNSLLPDSCQNDKDDKDDGPSQSSSPSSVSNDLMNSGAHSTDASEASSDSQSSFQAKSESTDNNKAVEAADCSLNSQPSPAASDAGHSDSHLCLESNMDETVAEEQAAPSEEVVAAFSPGSDPSTFSVGDMTDESVKLTEGNAACKNGCSVDTTENTTSEGGSSANVTLDKKTNLSDPCDSPPNVTLDNKINASDSCDSAANVTLDNKTNLSDQCDSPASVTLENKMNASDPCDSPPNVTLDNKTNQSDPCDSPANVTLDNKINGSDPCDSPANVTLDNKTNLSDQCDSPASVTLENKMNASDPCDSATNVTLNDEENQVIKTVKTEQSYPEEKINYSNSDNVGVNSEAVNDEFVQNIESNQTKSVFGAEQGLAEESLVEKHEKNITTSCSTLYVTCKNQANDQSAENEHNAFPNLDIMDEECQLPKTLEDKTAPKNEIKQSSAEKSQIASCEIPSMEDVQTPVEGISCLESEMSEDEISTRSKPNYCDEEHFVHDEFGRPLTPSPSEMDERPESPEMKPSSAMSKGLQPIVLIKTSDQGHFSIDKYICAQCIYITSTVDKLIEHHNLQHSKCDFQLCKTCGVYFVHHDQSRKHLCGQESTVVSSIRVKTKRQRRFCNRCKISFPKWNVFVSHMRTHTGVTPYKCEKCKLYFAQQSTLTRHQRIPGRCRPSFPVRQRSSKKSHSHSLNSMTTCHVKLYDITKSPFCKFCGKFFQSWTKTNKHVYNVHKRLVTVPKQHKETFKTTEDTCPEKKKYKCPLCPVTFDHHLIRNRHLKDCLKECTFGKRNRVSGRYKCPLCLSTFTLTSNRYRHVYTSCLRNFLSFLGKEITIPIKFPRYSKAMKTVLTKLKAEEDQLNRQSSVNETCKSVNETCIKQNSQFKCNVCSAVFSNKSTKYRHIKKHKGHKFKSSHLVDKTSIVSSLVADTEIQKKYSGSLKCKYCEKSFGSSQALKKHEFTHQGERPFYCSQCGKGFKSRVVLTHHKITHQRRIQCTVCKKILPTIGELIQHRTTHLNRGLLQCPDCPRKFTFPVYLVRHLRYHLKTQNKLLQEDDKEMDSPSPTSDMRSPCHLCSEVFDDTDSLKRHYFTHIQKSSSPKCPFCKRKFTGRRYLLRHIARHFGGKRLSKDKTFIAHHKTLSPKLETKGEFVCRHCSRNFQNKGHLMRHYRGHNSKSLSKCATCNFYFGVSKIALHRKVCTMEAMGSKSQMTKTPLVHKVPSENLKYQCQHCSQSFKYLSLYYRHLSTHKGLEVHACILCGQSFPTIALCSQHEASCEGLYKCDEPKNSKKAEIVTKSGKGEFKCKFCHKVFSKSRNLRHHILTHNEVKPYRCKACDRCFSRYDHLKMHLGCCRGKEKLQLSPQIRIPKLKLDQVGTGWQTESEPGNVKQSLQCKICLQKYNSLSRLRWHISMLHTVKRVKCKKCSSFFSSEKCLKEHVRHRRCRVVNIVKGKTLQQTQIRRASLEKQKQNVLLARILPTSTDENAKTEIKCNLCLRTFRTSTHLKVHMVLHREKSFACDCGKRFFQKRHLVRHMDTCVKKQNQSPTRGFSCAYCSSRFLLFSQLQDHFLNAHKVETKNEPIETTPLQQHLSNLQHCEENQLDVQVSEQPQTSNLKKPSEDTDSEMTSQLRESPYPCKKCNRGFWNKTLLRNHYRKCWRKVTTEPLDEDMPLRADIDMVLDDSGAESSPEEEIEDIEPPNKSSQEKKTTVYQCSECDKSFTDGLLLISHLEAHGREEQEKRLNKCSKCGRTFLNQARLEKHMKAIHETAAIICKYCSKEFPSNPELENHRKQAHNPSNPYCCRLCRYRFKTRTTFSDHCAKMHPDDVFSCHMCNRSYTLRASLIRHNKKWHPELIEGSEKLLGTQSSSESEAASAPAPAPTRGGGGLGGRDGGDDDDDDTDDDSDDDSDSGSDSNSDSADSDSAPYFPCHVCGKTFTTSESLEDHQRCHLGEKPHECAQCGQCFFLAGQLLQHERKHKSEFQCKICGRGFVSLFALRKHKHTSGKKRPFKCSKCLLYFTTPALLAEHMVIHREESFPCDICNRVFPSKSSRAEHRKIHMPKSSPTKPPEQPAVKVENKPIPVSGRVGNEFKYRCGVCCLRFKNPEELSEHGCLASTERPYSCSDCDKHFLHPSHLKKHLSKHKAPLSQSKYSCNQCKNSFTSQDFLNHLRNHDGTILSGEGFVCPVCHQCFTSPAELAFHFPNHPSGTFQCKTCNKTFVTATELKEHEVCHNKTKCEKCGQSVQGAKHECSPRHVELMKIVSSFADEDEIDVTGEDLCFCPFCPMQFSSRSNLLDHQNRMHPNEKSYSCEVCARTYARQTDLDKHMKKHHPITTDVGTSQIKFQCTQCQSEFSTAKDLSVHLKLHAAEKEVGEHRCDMCYKSFNQVNLLRRHQESHVGQVVYECNDCDKAFAFPHLLEEHQKTHV